MHTIPVPERPGLKEKERTVTRGGHGPLELEDRALARGGRAEARAGRACHRQGS